MKFAGHGLEQTEFIKTKNSIIPWALASQEARLDP